MAVSYVGGSVGTDALPAHQVGDLILVFGFRNGSTIAPGTLSGYTDIHASGANTCSMRLQYKIATSTSESSPAMSNASCHVRMVFRGTHPTTPIGNFLQRGGSSTTVVYDAVTSSGDGRGAYVGFCGHRSVNTSLETPPTGMVAGPNHLNATAEAVGHYQLWNRGVNWPATSVNVGGTSSGFRGIVVELLPANKVVGELLGFATAEATGGADCVFASNAIPGVAAGDALLLVSQNDASVRETTPTGWALLHDTSMYGSYATSFIKAATSSDVSVTLGNQNNRIVAILAAFHKAEWYPTAAVAVQYGAIPASPYLSDTGFSGRNRTYLTAAFSDNNDDDNSLTPPSGYISVAEKILTADTLTVSLAQAASPTTATAESPGAFTGGEIGAWAAATLCLLHGVYYTANLTTPAFSFAAAPLSFLKSNTAVLSTPAFSLTAPALTYLGGYEATVTFSTFEYATNTLKFSTGYRFVTSATEFALASLDVSWFGEAEWEVSPIAFSIEAVDVTYQLVISWSASTADFPMQALAIQATFPVWSPMSTAQGANWSIVTTGSTVWAQVQQAPPGAWVGVDDS